MSISPLTGNPLAEEPKQERGIWFYREQPFGRYALTEWLSDYGMKWDGELDVESLKLNQKQTKRLQALALSKAVEAKILSEKPPPFMTQVGKDNMASKGLLKGDDYHAWHVVPVESLWQELSELTLETKALRTLAILASIEEETGQGIDVSFSFDPYPGAVGQSRDRFISLQGLAYACVPSEIPVVMQYLRQKGLIEEGNKVVIGTTIHLTPNGYMLVDSMSKGDAVSNYPAFLVCRFIDELNAIFEAVYEKVGTDGKVPIRIQRVCDIHHVDRIDDRIIAEIKKAPIVVVDLTKENFNVAFEAGFALSLNKPIVWTMQKPTEDLRLPFDIQSHNVLIYEPDRLELFKEHLEFRILAALSKAQEQSRWTK